MSSTTDTAANTQQQNGKSEKIDELKFVKIWIKAKSRQEVAEKTGFSINTVRNWANRINASLKAAGAKELKSLPRTENGRVKGEQISADDIIKFLNTPEEELIN